MTEKSVDEYVDIAIRFQRDQDFRLYIVHMKAKKSEIGTEKMFDLMLAALNVRSRVQCSPQDQILNYLYNKEMLLVLDGFQPCADNARFLNQLLQRAPRVTVMETARRRVAVRAEWLLALTGLDYPPEETSVGLMGYSAIQFFAQQWHQLQGHDPSNDLEWQAVAHICRLVEGNPLTIERAVVAAWSSSIMHTATACETDRHARPTHGLIEKSPNRLSLSDQRVGGRCTVVSYGISQQPDRF